MTYDPQKHHRRSVRLQGYDYTQTGAYFVTLCTWQREPLLGEIIDGEMRLNDWGRVLEAEWLRTAEVRPNVDLDAFVVMPNHLHGILVIGADSVGVGTSRRLAPTPAPTRVTPATRLVSGSLGAIIGQIKSITTKRINALRGAAGFPVWQRNYYEHIVRNEADLNRIREYIAANPARWAEDDENPSRRR